MRMELQVKDSCLAGVQTTAERRTTRKWSQEENRVVRQCYYRSEYETNEYRKRMHVI